MPISGTWFNELGSTMQLNVSGSTISGTYNTGVGSASGDYTVLGQIDTAASGTASATGWTVAWNNAAGSSHSATSWSGLYQPQAAGTEEIYTLWLMAREMSEHNQWDAINVGQDTFTRTAPGAEVVAARQARGMAPHPTSSRK
jgi:hypothetical protein